MKVRASYCTDATRRDGEQSRSFLDSRRGASTNPKLIETKAIHGTLGTICIDISLKPNINCTVV